MELVSLDDFQAENFRREIAEDFFDILKTFEDFGGLPRSGADQESINLDLILELIFGGLRGSVYLCFANKLKPALIRNGKRVYINTYSLTFPNQSME